jgi:hypothetical protein
MPPDSVIAQQARVLGAETRTTPADAGMALVLDWDALIPTGYRVAHGMLLHLDTPVLRTTPAALTQIVLGGFGVLQADVDVLPEYRAGLERDFPERFPHWSLEPFWH